MKNTGDLGHLYDVTIDAGNGPQILARSDVFSEAAAKDENFDCAGTFGCAGTAFGCLGSIGTFGCCC